MSPRKIRDANKADLPAIVEIYNASIPTRIATADLEPISLESRQQWFDEHSPNSKPIWVMEIEAKIAGWLSFQSFYGRRAYHKTAELSIYISPLYQRQGIGKQLLQTAIDRSPSLGLNTLIGLVFAHNQPSLQLLTKYQFQQWGYLPKVADMDGIDRDLIIMGRRIVI
jgi:L-amino acid N-acyltransferase YncA